MLSIMILITPPSFVPILKFILILELRPLFFNCIFRQLKIEPGLFLVQYSFPFSHSHIFLIGSYMATSLYCKFETCDRLAANLVPLFVFFVTKKMKMSPIQDWSCYNWRFVFSVFKGKCTLKFMSKLKKRK